jgi:hypothetical protein
LSPTRDSELPTNAGQPRLHPATFGRHVLRLRPGFEQVLGAGLQWNELIDMEEIYILLSVKDNLE